MQDPKTIRALSIAQMQKALRAGSLTSVALTEAFLEQIEHREPEVGAWVWHDPDAARRQAAACDAIAGMETARLGPLHGIPVGLKDVIDTSDMPTQNGTPPDTGRQPSEDAWVTARLRAAGAVIMGKTTTTELAFLTPTETRNPHNPNHTPGGSSAGSAAAVGADMVPLAVGTQTGGSVIRPAAFCGVTGVKPTFNLIPRDGVTMQSHTLDTLGVFTRSPQDAVIALAALSGQKSADASRIPDSAFATPASPATMRKPVFGFVTPPEWERATPETHEVLGALAEELNAIPLDLPPAFDTVASDRACINFVEMAWYYRRYRGENWEKLSEGTRGAMDAGSQTLATEYVAAINQREPLYESLGSLFDQVDCLLCPSALGIAPEGFASTGDAIFNGLWTFMGTPCVTLPLPRAPGELPLGVQLVGPRGEDKALLANAIWLADYLSQVDPS